MNTNIVPDPRADALRGEALRRALNDRRGILADVWTLLRRVAGRLPFAEDVAAAYFCVRDARTPRLVKLTLMAALAYFVLPTDAVADFLPIIGFADDAAVLTAAMASVRKAVKPEHYERARAALAGLDAEASEDPA